MGCYRRKNFENKNKKKEKENYKIIDYFLRFRNRKPMLRPKVEITKLIMYYCLLYTISNRTIEL